jgi:hypothetical protein
MILTIINKRLLFGGLLLLFISGCESKWNGDEDWTSGWRIDRMEVYSASTSEHLRTLYVDGLTLYRIYEGSTITLSMEQFGNSIWRIEGRSVDLFKWYESFDALQINLTKFEFIVIEWLNKYDCVMEINNGSIINGFNGIVEENEPISIYVYMTEFV